MSDIIYPPLSGSGTQSDFIYIGGRLITDLTNLKILYTIFGQTTNESTPREQNASSGYVVPAATTFRIVAVEMLTMSVAGPTFVGYADNDVGFAAGGGSFTNFVGIAGATFTQLDTVRTASVGEIKSVALNFEIPTGKYLAVLGPGGGGGTHATVKIYGYEV